MKLGASSSARTGPRPELTRPTKDNPGAAKASGPRAADKSALRLVGAELARTRDLEPGEALLSALGALDGAAALGLVARAERGAASPAEGWKALRRAGPGPALLPALAIRPGQSQLSFDHVAAKMVSIAQDILQKAPKKLAELFDEDDFPVDVGPGGGFAVLRDGHHKLGAILALSALVHNILGTGQGASSRTALKLGAKWRALAEVLPPPDALELPALVRTQQANLPANAEGEDAFFALFESSDAHAPPLYLAGRDGEVTARPPERWSQLEDNPFRRLAAELVAKYKWRDDGRPKLRKNDNPLWLKGPDAPEYVEFHIAEVLEAASEAIGFDYAPGAPLPEDVRAAFGRALHDARANGHETLQRVIAFEHDIDLEALGQSFALTRHAVIDFGRGEMPDPDDVPVLLLRSDAPDVHRLHAAAHLHAAVVEAGGELERDALDPDVARAALARLAHVHDDVGLWVNEAGLTRAELDRDATLAGALALRAEPKGKKKTKLELIDAPKVGGPLWVELPGLPASARHAVGTLLGDLFAKVDHDPERLHEIEDAARARLVSAKTDPEHPAYDRLAQVPVVVAGDAEALVASLRVGRKKRALETGRPVEGAQPPPHVLGPRARLRVED